MGALPFSWSPLGLMASLSNLIRIRLANLTHDRLVNGSFGGLGSTASLIRFWSGPPIPARKNCIQLQIKFYYSRFQKGPNYLPQYPEFFSFNVQPKLLYLYCLYSTFNVEPCSCWHQPNSFPCIDHIQCSMLIPVSTCWHEPNSFPCDCRKKKRKRKICCQRHQQ